jgi:hypothetical protein
MSLPGEGVESKLYNDISEVSRFFRTVHMNQEGLGFLIFNVCAERSYNIEYFNGQVVNIPIPVDSPATLENLCNFVERASEWLEVPSNVIALHDIDGMARSGVFVIAWLLYSGFTSASSVSLPLP